MDKNIKFAMVGLVGIIAVQQGVIAYQNDFINRQHKQAKKIDQVKDYLLNVIDREDVRFDKFDKIALNEIVNQ